MMLSKRDGTPVACPKLSTRLNITSPLFGIGLDACRSTWCDIVRIRHYSFLMDLTCFCATNPMISNVRSRTFLCSISCAKSHNLVVIGANAQLRIRMVSNLAPTPNVDVISWRATARTHGFA
ncbi:hypothetical protein BS47DRAFT_1352235 [Hydnum rufescens UP504]|uniref:Uncharacterized protein n=1 Tax=Hydnum rufescens UP504 TaxID=1448309 RepID=A0A9P6AJD4_9AGAM|nr:hypothetical protein BS47DRAFT_1352235 [Hydnum rufescens UP504]